MAKNDPKRRREEPELNLAELSDMPERIKALPRERLEELAEFMRQVALVLGEEDETDGEETGRRTLH